MKILFVHLLNNYTGSPKVLAKEIQLLSNTPDYDISLLTSKSDGVLSSLNNVKIFYNGYKWSNSKLILLLRFIIAQVICFLFVLFHHYDVIYVNTIVPFGAALAAKIRHRHIIYHVHEVYINPNVIKRLYYHVMDKSAERIICVSEYVKNNIRDNINRCSVIYNPVASNTDISNLETFIQHKYNNKKIFMVSSLREYKGLYQFIELAKNNTGYNFVLLCSASIFDIQKFFDKYTIPDNMTIIDKKENLLPYYQDSTLTINLSLPDKWIETFGLTIVEGFDSYSPAIAPDFGGPKEIITQGENGFLVNPYDLEEVSKAIDKICENYNTYKKFALTSKESIKKFNEEVFISNIICKINEVIK